MRKTSPRIKKWSSKKADTLFSRYIRSRDGKCVRCGRIENLQCSHFWPRAISSTRYDPDNCDTLCYACHYGNAKGWEHSKQGEYRSFKLNQLGKYRYQQLEERAGLLVKRENAIIQCIELLCTPFLKVKDINQDEER